uniref:Death domain-containing protein n=1 Tax=Amphimedon queenslandica TaxID=400682 RepID=A0A1X7V194_AMPQE
MATGQTCLDISDLIDVIDLLKICGFPETKWYELGLRIGLKKNTLDAIEKNHPHDVSRCMTECLSQWLDRADDVDSRGGANLDSLSDALQSMNKTAVAEKLKHHVLINIFNNRHTVLSQSLCDSVSIAWLLYGEHMLTQEAVSRVVSASPSIPNQREALLTAVKEAVQTDPNSLHTFANVLCTISTNVSLGQTILDDISKYFPTPEVSVVPETIKDHDIVVLQDNTSTADQTKITQSDTSPSNATAASNLSSQPLSLQVEVHVPVSKGLLEDFISIRMSYGRMFYNVCKIIKQKRCSLKDIKELLSCCGTVLSKKVKKCRDISSLLHIIQNECSLTNIALLHTVVDEMKITEADVHIKAYKTELKEFCNSLSISLCLKERFAIIPHLQCETVTFVLDWEPEEHLLKDIEELLAKASGKLLKIDYIKQTNSISVTCFFSSSDVGFTVLRMIENIHILMGQGLKKLTIGNLTLWRRQDVIQKEQKERRDLLQHTEVISYIILEEAEYKLRDAISSKEKELIELKREISMTQVPEEESLFVQSDTESFKEVEEEPLDEEFTALRSQFNEIQKESKELSDKLSKMKAGYLRSLTSHTDSAASKVRRGMTFEIDDCKFHLKAMTNPDYQRLVDNKRIIVELQEKITLKNMELITKREHKEKIIKDIKDLKDKETEGAAGDKETSDKEIEYDSLNDETKDQICLFTLYCNHPVTGEFMDSILKVHKDELLPTVLDKAYELMELAPHIPIERCRLVKYSYDDDVMEQSLDLDEFQYQTIGQIVDGTRHYPFELFIETCEENKISNRYNEGGNNRIEYDSLNNETKDPICLFTLYCNHPVTGELMDSILEVHKDELLPIVLIKAYELMKLAPHIPIERCRLVKYFYDDDVMEQSLDLDEFQHQTIGQIVGGTRHYPFDLFIETREESEIFDKYKEGGDDVILMNKTEHLITALERHPLQNKWVLWYLKNDKQKEWKDNLRKIICIDTVEEFWSVYNHIKPPSQLSSGCDYMLFKEGIEPMWHDKTNKNGGRWLLNIDKRDRKYGVLDNIWKETVKSAEKLEIMFILLLSVVIMLNWGNF